MSEFAVETSISPSFWHFQPVAKMALIQRALQDERNTKCLSCCSFSSLSDFPSFHTEWLDNLLLNEERKRKEKRKKKKIMKCWICEKWISFSNRNTKGVEKVSNQLHYCVCTWQYINCTSVGWTFEWKLICTRLFSVNDNQFNITHVKWI